MRYLFAIVLATCLGPQAWAQCAHEIAPNGERCTLDADAYLGLAIDTFAAAPYQTYVYASASTQDANGAKERSVAGFDFEYRLFSRRTGEQQPDDNFKRELWVYGQTIHGVRSADINCSTNAAFPGCQSSVSQLPSVLNPGQTLLYLLRNASSLEGHLGFRWEFARLNDGGGLDVAGSPASLYLKAQAGFLKVSGLPGGGLGIFKIALGGIATKGLFTGSYVDAGFGRNDVFQFHRRRRTMVDAYLERKLIAGKGLWFFAQMLVDTDLGPGSDSFQTLLGVKIDLTQLF